MKCDGAKSLGQFNLCIFVVITTISALTSKPNRNLLGIIELGAKEFVKRCVKDIVELEEGFEPK